MPVEARAGHPTDRARVTHLEALGRALRSAGTGDLADGKAEKQRELRDFVRRSTENATTPLRRIFP